MIKQTEQLSFSLKFRNLVQEKKKKPTSQFKEKNKEFSREWGEFGILKCASVSVDHKPPPTFSSFVLFFPPCPLFKRALILQFTQRLSCSVQHLTVLHFQESLYFSQSRIHSVPLCWLGYVLGPQRAES